MTHGTRKTLLATAGTLAFLTLIAGCSSANDKQDGDNTNTDPTSDTLDAEGYTTGPSDDQGTDEKPPANPEEAVTDVTPFDEALTVGETVYVTSDADLHSDPSATAASLTTVPENSQVTVAQTAASSGFYQVTFGGKTGWVSALFLATQADIDGTPLTPDPPPTTESISPNLVFPESTGGVSASGTAAANGQHYVDRAMQWVVAKMPYCGGVNGGTDLICGGICHRSGSANNAVWNKYRSDCSGLVSWAWSIPAPGQTTAGLAPFSGRYSYAIGASSLRMGDAINSVPSHHIMLFAGWVDDAHTTARVVQEYNCGHIAAKMKLPVQHNGKYLYLSWDKRNFLPIRKRH